MNYADPSGFCGDGGGGNGPGGSGGPGGGWPGAGGPGGGNSSGDGNGPSSGSNLPDLGPASPCLPGPPDFGPSCPTPAPRPIEADEDDLNKIAHNGYRIPPNEWMDYNLDLGDSTVGVYVNNLTGEHHFYAGFGFFPWGGGIYACQPPTTGWGETASYSFWGAGGEVNVDMSSPYSTTYEAGLATRGFNTGVTYTW